MARITTLKVGGTYNQGNYSNRVIEVSLELETADDPGLLASRLRAALEVIGNPCPVDDYQYRDAQRAIQKPDPNPYGMSLPRAKELVLKVEDWNTKVFEAEKVLSEIGGIKKDETRHYPGPGDCDDDYEQL